jgi:hypothetical protein
MECLRMKWQMQEKIFLKRQLWGVRTLTVLYYYDGVRQCQCGIGFWRALCQCHEWYEGENGVGVVVVWYWHRKIEGFRGKPVPVLYCPPQIPHGLPWAWTWPSVWTSQRLTTWALAWPKWLSSWAFLPNSALYKNWKFFMLSHLRKNIDFIPFRRSGVCAQENDALWKYFKHISMPVGERTMGKFFSLLKIGLWDIQKLFTSA